MLPTPPLCTARRLNHRGRRARRPEALSPDLDHAPRQAVRAAAPRALPGLPPRAGRAVLADLGGRRRAEEVAAGALLPVGPAV